MSRLLNPHSKSITHKSVDIISPEQDFNKILNYLRFHKLIDFSNFETRINLNDKVIGLKFTTFEDHIKNPRNPGIITANYLNNISNSKISSNININDNDVIELLLKTDYSSLVFHCHQDEYYLHRCLDNKNTISNLKWILEYLVDNNKYPDSRSFNIDNRFQLLGSVGPKGHIGFFPRRRIVNCNDEYQFLRCINLLALHSYKISNIDKQFNYFNLYKIFNNSQL